MNLETDLALIKQKVEFIEKNLIENIQLQKEIHKHVISSDDFNVHTSQDRWMFGILATMLIGIFIKLMVK